MSSFVLPGWASRAYVTWFGVSSFFLPLAALTFFYANIYKTLRDNLDSQTTSTPAKAFPAGQPGRSISLPPRRTGMLPPTFRSTLNGRLPPRDEGSFRPRTHSIEGITRAKVKSVRQTVIIIMGYVVCSAPAVGFQMWTVWIKEDMTLSKTATRTKGTESGIVRHCTRVRGRNSIALQMENDCNYPKII